MDFGIADALSKLKLPSNWYGVLTVLIVCGTVAVCLYIGLVLVPDRNIRAFAGMMNSAVYSESGQMGERSETIYRFWTPNMNTKRDILGVASDTQENNINRSSLAPYYWASDKGQSLIEPEVEEFIKRIKLMQPQGFNIYEAYGVGTNNLKRGYVWEITFSKENSVSRNQLLATYADFWKRKDKIWLEEYHISSKRD